MDLDKEKYCNKVIASLELLPGLSWNAIETKLVPPRLFLILHSDNPKIYTQDVVQECQLSKYDFACPIVCSHVHGDLLILYLNDDSFVIYNLTTDTKLLLKQDVKVNRHVEVVKITSEEREVVIINKKNEYFKFNVFTQECKNLFEVGNCGDLIENYAELSFVKIMTDNNETKSKIITNNIAYLKSNGSELELYCNETDTNMIIHCDFKVHRVINLNDTKQFLLLTENEDETRSIILSSFLNFKIELEIKNVMDCVLVGGCEKTLFYLIHRDGNIFTHKVEKEESLMYVETLTSKGNYDEAQEYAIQHGLDIQLLYKTKANKLLKKVLDNNADESLRELQTCLENLTDFDLVLNICSKLVQKDLKYTSILRIVKKKFFLLENADTRYRFNELKCKTNILHFMQLSPELCDDDELVNSVFNESIINICKRFVAIGNFQLASVCWIKYDSIKIMEYCTKDVELLLNSIPYSTKLNSLLLWLSTFLRPILRENPLIAETVLSWTIDRICTLEKSKYWPDIGIKLGVSIMSILDESCKPLHVLTSNYDRIHLLLSHIETIKNLKEKFRINILIGEFTRFSSNEMVKIVLHRSFSEDLKSLILDFLPNFMIQNDLQHDELLREYTEDLLQSSVIDESRLEIIIDCFFSVEKKLSCMLIVLQAVEIPWSDKIKCIANRLCALDHKLTENIQMEIKYAEVRMVLKKYNYAHTWTDYEHVLQKLISRDATDLNEVKTILFACNRLSRFSQTMYIEKTLRTNNLRFALDFYKTLSKKEQFKIGKILKSQLEGLLSSHYCERALEQNYLDFMTATNITDTLTLQLLNKLYVLKNCYNIVLTLGEYCREHIRIQRFNEWCQANIISHERYFYQKCLHLASILKVQTETALGSLLDITSGEQVKSLIRVLQQNIKYFPVNILIKKLHWLSIFQDSQNTELLNDLICSLITYIQVCKKEDLKCGVQILYIINTLKILSGYTKISANTWKAHNIYMVVPTATSINNIITLYTIDNSNKHEKTTKMLKLLEIVPDHLTSIKVLSSVVSIIKRDGLSVPEVFYTKREGVAKHVSTKLLLSRNQDDLFLTNILNFVSNPIQYLKGLLQNQLHEDSDKKFVIASYILRSHKLFKGEVLTDNYISQLQKLYKSDTNSLECFTTLLDQTDTTDTKTILFNILKSDSNIDSETVIKLCKTLNILLDEGLLLLILTKIDQWKLKFNLVKDVFGAKHIEVLSDESAIYESCRHIVNMIRDKEVLFNCLKQLWCKGEVTVYGVTITLNHYLYEIYLVINKLLMFSLPDWKVSKEFMLLQFLRYYRRTIPPKESEIETHSIKGYFPNIGHHRLPFQLFLTADLWAGLKSEITLDTYKLWMPLVSLLSLNTDLQVSRDQICSNAVKRTMTMTNQLNESKVEMWNVFATGSELLKSAHECVQHISNMEWAAACLFYVRQYSRRGADQVAAAHLCYQFAQQWEKIDPNNNAVKKMQMKYLVLSTMHVLHKIGFSNEKFLNLCADPFNLIKCLYLDSHVLKGSNSAIINKAVAEIADTNGINISAVRMQILESILDNKSVCANDKKGLSKSTLVKALNILKATCPIMGAVYLARVGLENDLEFNDVKHLKTLQCLISLVDEDTLQKVTNLNTLALWIHILNLYSSIELDELEIGHLFSVLKVDKLEALSQIWHSAEHTKQLAAFIVKLCIMHKIKYCKIFKELINILVQYDMLNEMYEFLPLIECEDEDCLRRAWKLLLLAPFERADYPLSERQKASCLRVMNLLPLCSVLDEIELESIWKNCLRFKQPEIGCLILPFLEQEAKVKILEDITPISTLLVDKVNALQMEAILSATAVCVLQK